MFGSLRASRQIHKKLIESVLGTTLRFVFRVLIVFAVTTIISGGSILHLFLELSRDALKTCKQVKYFLNMRD